MTSILEEVKRIKSISDVGLLYCSNEYDRERYTELQAISFRLLEFLTDRSIEELKSIFPQQKDYPTAKVDIRGLLMTDDDKVLLVKESADQKWSLPGGWADIGYSPKEVVVKEFKEETGLDVYPERLLAVFDKKKHAHPPQPFYIYKLVFLCRPLSSELLKGFDVLDVNYFEIDNLPALSEDRILESQINLLVDHVKSNDPQVYFD